MLVFSAPLTLQRFSMTSPIMLCAQLSDPDVCLYACALQRMLRSGTVILRFLSAFGFQAFNFGPLVGWILAARL